MAGNSSHLVTIPVSANATSPLLRAGSYSSGISDLTIIVRSDPQNASIVNTSQSNGVTLNSNWSIQEREVPEPLTILGSLTVAGFLPLLKKTKKIDSI